MKKIVVFITGIGGFAITFILSFIFWILKPDLSIPFWSLMVALTIFCFIVVIVVFVASQKLTTVLYKLPSIKSITIQNDRIIFAIEKNELFFINSYVTFFYRINDDLDIPFATGYVSSINEKGTPLVTLMINGIDKTSRVFSEIRDIANTKKYRDNIIIKPSVDIENINGGI